MLTITTEIILNNNNNPTEGTRNNNNHTRDILNSSNSMMAIPNNNSNMEEDMLNNSNMEGDMMWKIKFQVMTIISPWTRMAEWWPWRVDPAVQEAGGRS